MTLAAARVYKAAPGAGIHMPGAGSIVRYSSGRCHLPARDRSSFNEGFMANTSSAKKMARKIERRTVVNGARRSRMRTFLRKVEEAIAGGDQAAANQALRTAEPELMRAAQHGIVHKNTASRKVSRLASRIKALA